MRRGFAAAIALILLATTPLAQGSPSQHLGTAERTLLPGAAQQGCGHASLQPRQTVTLPDAWNGQCLSGVVDYRLRFQGPTSAPNPAPNPAPPPGSEATEAAAEADASADAADSDWVLYLPRIGSRFAVYLNEAPTPLYVLGPVVADEQTLHGRAPDYAQRPQLIPLPRSLLKAGAENTLRLRVAGDKARYAGLSDAWVGPRSALAPVHDLRELLQLRGSFAMLALALALAVVSLVYAWRARDRHFAWFALACGFFALRTCWAVVALPPFDARWWGLFVDVAYAGYVLCLAAFATDLLKLDRRWVQGATALLLALTAVLLPLHAFGRMEWARQAWLMALLAHAAGVCVLVLWAWLRKREPAGRVLGPAAALTLGLAAYDHLLVFYLSNGYSGFALTRYSLLLFLLATGWLLAERAVRAERQALLARDRFAQQLARSRQQLQQEFDRLQEASRLRAQHKERTRILSDIHDGIGLQLTSLLGMLEQGPLLRDELQREVRTTIEQVRLLVHSDDTVDANLALLLGEVRHQLERRLKHCGLALGWTADADLGLDVPLAAHQAMALKRLFFELATNAIRHAAASRVDVVLQRDAQQPQRLSLRFSDDGQGFQPAAAHGGHGLRSMARRAEDLHATWRFDAAPGRGATFCLELDLQRLAAEAGAAGEVLQEARVTALPMGAQVTLGAGSDGGRAGSLH